MTSVHILLCRQHCTPQHWLLEDYMGENLRKRAETILIVIIVHAYLLLPK